MPRDRAAGEIVARSSGTWYQKPLLRSLPNGQFAPKYLAGGVFVLMCLPALDVHA